MLRKFSVFIMLRKIISSVALVFLVAAAARAETYPNRPIRLVVSYPAGGATDTLGRLVAEALGDRLGQRIIVDNRGGAAGMIGASSVAKAAPDGYTLIIATATTHAVNPTLFKDSVTYDPIKDFTPISFVGLTPLMLVTHPSVPVSNIPELIAYVKSKEGNISYASGGTGSVPHMAGELFKLMAGLKIPQVPYRGDAPATNDVIAGHLPYMFGHVPIVLALVRGGQLKGLGVTSAKRTEYAPDIPTIAEQGLPGYEINTWWGIFGPAGLPKEIVTKLNDVLNETLSDPKVKERFFSRGYEVKPNSPEEFTAFVKAEYEKWGKVVEQSGMRETVSHPD